MSQANKLLERIRNNPRDVAFTDACKAAELLGFASAHGKGSHRVFQRTGEQTALNFQDRKGRIRPYQARQLIDMMDKYEGQL